MQRRLENKENQVLIRLHREHLDQKLQINTFFLLLLLLLFLQPMDLSQSALQVSQPSANTGGMISSAAASVTSWFRAYTGQR